MKVLIIDGLHDSDRGGAGIVAGLAESLYTVAQETSTPIELGLVYRYSADDERFTGAARHTRNTFPRIEIYANPIRTFSNRRGFLKKLDFLCILLGAFFKLIVPSFPSNDVARAMQNADFVISKGGHFYQSHLSSSVTGFVHTFLSVYNLLLAIRLRKKFVLIAHSVGPFNNPASKKITSYIFKKACFLSTREEASKDVLVDLGIEASRIELVPDTAFALTPARGDDVVRYLDRKGLKNEKYAVVTSRYWDFPNSDRAGAVTRYSHYLHVLADIADYLIEEGYANKILLMVHNDGQHLEFEDDSKPVHEIFQLIRNKRNAIVIDDDLSPAMQSTLYGGAVITIGTRMHSVIFALVGGGPAIAISYNHKTVGIMEMLGLGKYVLPIDSMDVRSATEMIETILDDRANVTSHAEEKIGEFRSNIKETLRTTVFHS